MKCNCLRLKSPLPEREGTTKTKIWAGLSWFCICACSKRDWGRRCPRPSSQPSTPLPATFPVAGTDGLCTMHGRAQPKTHHPHRLSSRFHTPTPLNGLCLKEGKQNKTKKTLQKKKKNTQHTYAFCSVVCGSNQTEQLGTATSPKQPSPPSCAHLAQAPCGADAVPGSRAPPCCARIAELGPIAAVSAPALAQPGHTTAQGRFCAGQRTPGSKSKHLRGAGVNEVGKDPKSSFPPRAYGAARWATPCSFGFPDPSPPSQGEP